MTPQTLRNEIVDYCREHGTEENIIKYARFFKEGFKGHGLTSPQAKELVAMLKKKPGVTVDLVIDTMPLMLPGGMYEEISIPLTLLDALHKQLTRQHFDAINSWFAKGIHNWAHADILGMMVLPKFIEKELITMQAFAPWLTSPYHFQRRCVPVTLIKSLKNASSFTDIFNFLEPLMRDPQREVHQGMGWFLREAWKNQPLETESFLLKWKEGAPRLIIQYACEKMTPEGKARFKRSKK